ncbi:MAG: metal ABC transporter permease [Ardenticatenales bacterium]
MADWAGAVATWLAGPWQGAFMAPKFAAILVLAPVCGVVGTFLVLRRMAFFGDALAHAILPGIAIGYIVAGGASAAAMFGGALGAALVAAVGISALRQRAEVAEDSAIGIVFAAMFALGIALISRPAPPGVAPVDLSHILIGQILAVGWGDVWRMAAVGVVVLVVIAALYKELVIASFDSVLATTLRLPLAALDTLLLVLLAVTIVIGLQAVGVVLMVAFLVTPAATAFLVTDRLPQMMALSTVVALASGLIGLYVTYYAEIAASAAIVLPCTLCFGAAFAWTGWKQRRRDTEATPSALPNG